MEKVKLISSDTGKQTIFTFLDGEEDSTLVVYEEDFTNSTLSVLDPRAKQAQCNLTIADLKRYAESSTGQAATNASNKKWW